MPLLRINKKIFFKIIRYLIALILIIWAISRLAPHFKDFSSLWYLKNQINSTWISLAVFCQILQYLGDAWLSQILLKMVHLHFSMKDTFRIASLNVFAAHLLPVGDIGGLAAAYHFYKKLGVDSEKFIFVTFAWAVIANITLLLLLTIPLFLLPSLPLSILKPIIFGLAILFFIALVLYFFRKKLFIKLEKTFIKQIWFKSFSSFLSKRKDYKKAFFSHPILVLGGLLASFIYYLSNVGTLYFSFLAFGITPSFPLVIFAYTASMISTKITLVPAGIGAAEATLLLVFSTSSLDPKITLAAIIAYRIISFWLPIPAGYFSYYSLKKEVKRKTKK